MKKATVETTNIRGMRSSTISSMLSINIEKSLAVSIPKLLNIRGSPSRLIDMAIKTNDTPVPINTMSFVHPARKDLKCFLTHNIKQVRRTR
ncbi:MAG: hypothetical protein ABSB79_01585 [Syntrophales bacterium]